MSIDQTVLQHDPTSNEFYAAQIRSFVKASMLVGHSALAASKTPIEESDEFKSRCVVLLQRFGHLLTGKPRFDETTVEIPPEVVPLDQVELRSEHETAVARARLESWFDDETNEQKRCIESVVLWMMIAFYSSTETKARVIRELRTIESSDSVTMTPFRELLLDSLAHCYHFRMFLADYIATLNFNQQTYTESERAMRDLIEAHDGVVVARQSNIEPRHSHCRFREFMALTDSYPTFNTVNVIPSGPCFLCGTSLHTRAIPAIRLSYPGVDERSPIITVRNKRTGEMVDVDRGRYQCVACAMCHKGLESWWAVYHFLDVIVRKNVEVYVRAHPDKSLRQLHEGFLAEKQTTLVNQLRLNTKRVFNDFNFYFKARPPVELVEGIFAQDVFAQECDRELYEAMQYSLERVLSLGQKSQHLYPRQVIEKQSKSSGSAQRLVGRKRKRVTQKTTSE